eukprot:gene7645-15652_t
MEFESQLHIRLGKDLLERGRYHEANEHMWLGKTLDLTNTTTTTCTESSSTDTSPPCAWRMHIGLGGRMQRLTDCVKMLRGLIRGEDHLDLGTGIGSGGMVTVATVHLKALIRTVNIHFWDALLELCVCDPQAVHLRGGVTIMLRAARSILSMMGLRKSTDIYSDELNDQLNDLHGSNSKYSPETTE